MFNLGLDHLLPTNQTCASFVPTLQKEKNSWSSDCIFSGPNLIVFHQQLWSAPAAVTPHTHTFTHTYTHARRNTHTHTQKPKNTELAYPAAQMSIAASIQVSGSRVSIATT